MTSYGDLTEYRDRAAEIGVKAVTFYARIQRGWTPERAATTPTRMYFYEWKGACA